MTRSKIQGITVKAVKAEGYAFLSDWVFYAVPKNNVQNPFGGTIRGLFTRDTYRCYYGYPDGDSYTTSTEVINPGVEYKFPGKSLTAPATYPFDSEILALRKTAAGFVTDSGIGIASNSADQQAGYTALPWLSPFDVVVRAPKGSTQSQSWTIKNYGAAGNVYVGLWDGTDGEWLDAMINWFWLEKDKSYTDTFTYTFPGAGHWLYYITYYWYNETSLIYMWYAWKTLEGSLSKQRILL